MRIAQDTSKQAAQAMYHTNQTKRVYYTVGHNGPSTLSGKMSLVHH